ncbi:DUF4184 family protein [Microbacterium gorillae]|uniref:DUF4184 family protein n=1 Tax=Microbacterium gorillae TaxID=1231063 RepID=UPI00058B5A23|nr:DUF4184 family protein [Microbacterium gorillae]
MPFTPSHAVVALPFLRTPLIPGAIAVGSMTPDLPLFLPVNARRLLPYGVLHDPRWLAVTVVVALVLLLGWRLLLRPALSDLAPTWTADRLPESWRASSTATVHETFVGARGAVPTCLLLLLSLALGVLSHIAWDSFTHEGREGTSLIPALDDRWGPLLGYKWVQYGSSVFGLVVIGIWAYRWWSRRRPHEVQRTIPAIARVLWWIALPVLLVAFAVFGYLRWGPLSADFTVQHLAYATLPQACGVWGALTVVLCAVIVISRARRARG